jgi:hypothetical protein
MFRLRLLTATLLISGGGCLPVVAQAAQRVALQTGFTPDKLGEPTTISFAFTITSTTGKIPSPLTSVNLHLPSGINPATATIGDGECQPNVLLKQGVGGCAPNATLGAGTALVGVSIGPEVVYESAKITVLNGPPDHQHLVFLFYAVGATPVSAQFVFPSEIFLNQEGPFSGRIDTNLPPIPSLPGAPDVSVLNFQSTLGPMGITYTRRVHGKTVRFHPEGVAVPTTCPRGGFRFSANFAFMDGTTTTAYSRVPCPPSKHHHKHG